MASHTNSQTRWQRICYLLIRLMAKVIVWLIKKSNQPAAIDSNANVVQVAKQQSKNYEPLTQILNQVHAQLYPDPWASMIAECRAPYYALVLNHFVYSNIKILVTLVTIKSWY